MQPTYKILLVEPPSSARNALAALLGDEGFEVASAGSCDEAFAMTVELEPAVVIADVEISLDCSLIARVGALPHHPTVIALTEFGRISPALAALRAGAADYLVKPIRGDELLVVLGKAIDHHELARELERLRAEVRRSAQAVH